MKKEFKITSYRQEDLLKMEHDRGRCPFIPKPLPPITVVASNHEDAALIGEKSMVKLHHCEVVVIQTIVVK